MKHLFIINPAAGSKDRTDIYRQEIEAVCEKRNLEYRIQVSEEPGHCTEIARQAAQTGEEYRIYACGGDGTLNEVVAGVVGYDNVAVTAYVGGSGNDFVKIFGETEPFRSLEQLLDCQEVTLDLVRCNEDISLNICSKNEEAAALSGFTHPSSILKKEDFILIKANWEPKSENIVSSWSKSILSNTSKFTNSMS